MRKLIGIWLIAASVALSGSFMTSYAQEEKPATEEHNGKAEHRADSGQDSAPAAEKPLHPYRADFVISELEDGKRINARHYSMLLNVGSWNQIKIGTRVPVSTGQNMFQYMDIGTGIKCRLIESGSDLAIDVQTDFSSLSAPEEQHSPQPITRQVSINGNTLVTSGKPVVIGIVDESTSKRQFQLEATVTRLR
jgi:hypothetical protein